VASRPTTTITRRALPALSFVDDCLVLAALNKCLAQSNKSPHRANATKKRKSRAAALTRPNRGSPR
jgi:hypothetical protein